MSARVEGSGATSTVAARSVWTRIIDSMSVGFDVPLDQPGQRSSSRLRAIGTALAWFSGVVGLAVLVGYAARQEMIVKVAPSLPPMYPNAALALSAGAVAVVGSHWERRESHAVASIAASVIFAIGAIGLILNAAGTGPTWFEALFPTGFVDSTTPVAGVPSSSRVWRSC